MLSANQAARWKATLHKCAWLLLCHSGQNSDRSMFKGERFVEAHSFESLGAGDYGPPDL